MNVAASGRMRLTSSATALWSGPITTASAAPVPCGAASSTCASSDWPAMGCSTFGSEDRMRVPSPAASTTVRLDRAVIVVGHLRLARHARPCAGHPRLYSHRARQTWMAGTSSAKTRFALLPGHDGKRRTGFPSVFNCFPPEIKPIRRPEKVRIPVGGAFPVNVCPVIRRGLEEGQGRLARKPDHLADFEADDAGGVLSGLLAEENELDRRTLWRIASWGAGATAAVIVAVMANQSSLGLKREQVAAADLTRQAQQIQLVARESQNEARRLAAAIDTLNGDRDRLYSRVTSLEQGLDSVTGAIARQGSVSA